MTFRRVLTAAALGCAAIGSAHAQTSEDNRAADALAADMRLLAANPLDIEALVTAGELTLKLGDPTAAAGFFTRAEKLDPNNPRVKAGWGSLMVRAERPGEALRRFQEAEARGLDPARYAADRGLAYDLVGQQERAQRDYRLVLRNGVDDEVTRRYALSLAISGRKDEALKLLDPLLLRSDRAAWRSRAFVLAMTGDTAGAEKIAQTMMSPGLGAGLAPFFRRLPQLSAADRAFAVNFGELAETPARVADARLVPALPTLGPDPYAPKPVVAALPAPVMVADTGNKRDKRRRRNEAPVAVARAPAPSPTPTPTPAPTAVAMVPPPSAAPRMTTVPPRVAVAPVTTPPSAPIVAVAVPIRTLSTPAPTPTPVRSAPTIAASSTVPPVIVRPTPTPVPTSPVSTASPATIARVAAAEPTPPVVVPAAPVATPEPPQRGVADQPSAAEAGVPAPTVVARASEDSVLARIVANTVATPAPAPRPAPTPVQIAKAEPKPAATKAPTKSTRTRAGKDETATTDAPVTTARTKRGRDLAAAIPDDSGVPTRDARGRPIKVAVADDVPALDKNGCPLPPTPTKSRTSGKRGATAAAARKVPLSAKCKALAAAAAEKAKADAEAKSSPARVWVQVAGGANEASLEKAWQIMRDRAPALLRGRQGWTTPLRATNRVLTGPFNDTDEAQSFVNKLTKAGVPAFVFTSTKGQKVEKLSGK
ncbi:MAG: tetratricopeptide repeat protein [Sphingomonas sp.]|uniref:SPOR domain-containing protein n=1 Tax=Sphingomonas sp. TaxID=28214 RepID=UPI001AD04A5D|nr:SPOR domain-containing protein [Sphingomonas sp.]MBN8808352.1 tetratricopeptide repeat protein [Sphingomonas sp.]